VVFINYSGEVIAGGFTGMLDGIENFSRTLREFVAACGFSGLIQFSSSDF
jgi:hypothetical protein